MAGVPNAGSTLTARQLQLQLLRASWLVQWLRAADLQRQFLAGAGVAIDKQASGWLFATAMSNLERAAIAILGKGHSAVRDYRRAAPHASAVRDMVTHFDDYLGGEGNLQKSGQVVGFSIFVQNGSDGVTLHVTNKSLHVDSVYEAGRVLIMAVDKYLDKEVEQMGIERRPPQ